MKKNIVHLIKKSNSVIKKEGVKSFIKKGNNYIRNRYSGKTSSFKKSYKDILFINGCYLDHPRRYRVSHQIEQLNFVGYSCDEVWYENLDMNMLKYYRGFIFYRCPSTPLILEFIDNAKKFNKRTFFDIDDLVIDKKYVETIKYLDELTKEDYNLYIDGVQRMQETLRKCDYGITTTTVLAKELNNYTKEVFVNNNVASERMVEISEKAIQKKKKNENIYLGYLSGSITHNPDFELISDVIKELLLNHENLYLVITGLVDIPNNLLEVKNKIIKKDFVEWKKLPAIIAELDINLVPLEKSIFNEAKSENKWVEASLVKTVTVASKLGPFAEMIEEGITGFLCDTEEEWYKTLNNLVLDSELRNIVAENAYKETRNKNITAYTGMKLANFLESKLAPNILMVLPSVQISGGVNVAKKHCNILKKYGFDITILSMGSENDNIDYDGEEINVLSIFKSEIHAYFKTMVGTLWSTMEFVNSYPKVKEKKYLVQNFETDFYEIGHYFRKLANLTYNFFSNVKYITISKWCEKWLIEDFNKDVNYARNGIDIDSFKAVKRDFSGKIKILIEGNSEDYYKNVDESFKITNQLDGEKFEIVYLSYKGKPKDWYRVNKFYNRIPHEKVHELYQECHILIKSSILESFSYPPLEMMSTGGLVVVAPNGGNIEYLKDRENCLMYTNGNFDEAIQCINLILQDNNLREKIIENGLKTGAERDWKLLEKEIIKLYE
ncbi:glycosyltransferase [Sebaldella sp. S0638]|uniref:glycosyltransferase n=1 Tax=Sebaldella sp. S0638 TaxID=2957809 RepID=UPI0020A0001E|nr:glycosyltransferase [Sebaldella sp. S0638]MCP1223394.1 glycosyltransferase [Sebaldella sp. S0638]